MTNTYQNNYNPKVFQVKSNKYSADIKIEFTIVEITI